MTFLFSRYRKKDHNPNVGGLGLGFKEKTFIPPSSVSSSAPAPVAKGPATDRLSAMKAAFKTQYQNQVVEQ